MTGIYLETGKAQTPEFEFIATLTRTLGFKKDEDFEIITVNGKDNLENVANDMLARQITGSDNLIIFDADSPENRGGYSSRRAELEGTLTRLGVKAEIFLFPDNSSDGDIETLLLNIAQKELHKIFFDCFCDFECCVSKDYIAPNRKALLHTFVTSQRWLSRKQRHRIGCGNWLFDNKQLWDLDSDALSPLKAFLKQNI